MSEIFEAEYEHQTESFVFPEVTSEKADQLAAAEKKVKDAVESFAKALDSISP
jgi:predicted Holliday junction resolvase-like endonuclease